MTGSSKSRFLQLVCPRGGSERFPGLRVLRLFSLGRLGPVEVNLSEARWPTKSGTRGALRQTCPVE